MWCVPHLMMAKNSRNNFQFFSMNIKQIKDNISIVDFLSKLGFEPKRVRGSEHYYISMIRDSDTDPSLAVNDSKGLWNDLGQAKGGNIIDLAFEIFETKDLSIAIDKISKLYNNEISFSFSQQKAKSVEPVIKHKIHSLKDLGNNAAISNYIASRGVWNAAQQVPFLKEVYYDYLNDLGDKKRYFGVGWENDSGGFDVRSKYGKICINVKDLLFKRSDSAKLNVFEGMFNYLSALELNKGILKENLIVLNSLSMVERSFNVIRNNKHIKDVDLFFDNGKGGRKMTELFLSEFTNSVDRSYLYKGHDDYNDFLMDESKKKMKPWEGSTSIESKTKISR